MIEQAKKLGRRLSIIGHEEILSYLERCLKSGRLSHAYIFLGPEDVGKETVARWWLEKILHQGSKAGERHSLENHPDVAVIERIRDEKTKKLKKLISIDQVRDLKEKLGLTSFLNSYKVALIREADHMSMEAANALLKTLEEPAGKTIIILLVEDTARIPETIVSRCQVIKFRIIPEKLIYDELRQRGADRDEAELLSRLAVGSPGIALKYYEDKELLDEYKENVRAFIRAAQDPEWKRFNFIDEHIKTRAEREEVSRDVKKLLSIWRGVMRDAFLLKLGMNDLVVNYWAEDEIRALGSRYDLIKLNGLLLGLKNTERYIEQNANIKLAVENFLLEF